MPDFDTAHIRRGTGSLKWDKRPDLQPFWVADMDFQSPPAVVDALQRRVEHISHRRRPRASSSLTTMLLRRRRMEQASRTVIVDIMAGTGLMGPTHRQLIIIRIKAQKGISGRSRPHTTSTMAMIMSENDLARRADNSSKERAECGHVACVHGRHQLGMAHPSACTIGGG